MSGKNSFLNSQAFFSTSGKAICFVIQNERSSIDLDLDLDTENRTLYDRRNTE